jgi:hypothetical protein
MVSRDLLTKATVLTAAFVAGLALALGGCGEDSGGTTVTVTRTVTTGTTTNGTTTNGTTTEDTTTDETTTEDTTTGETETETETSG